METGYCLSSLGDEIGREGAFVSQLGKERSIREAPHLDHPILGPALAADPEAAAHIAGDRKHPPIKVRGKLTIDF